MNPPPQLFSPRPWTVHPLEGGAGLRAVTLGAWGLGAVTPGQWSMARWPRSGMGDPLRRSPNKITPE